MHTNHSDASSWYENRDNQPHGLLIHPDEFTTYVNLELLPALILPGEPNMVSPVQVDPFWTVPWQLNKAREVLLEVRNENGLHTEYVWTTVQRLPGDDGALALIRGGPDAEGRTGIDAIRSA